MQLLSLSGRLRIIGRKEVVQNGQKNERTGCSRRRRPSYWRQGSCAGGECRPAAEVKCYGINGCAANSSCAVKADDLAAVKTLLGTEAFNARFRKSKEHSCKAHAGCGASSHILNWTSVSEDACKRAHGIVIEVADGKKVAKEL